MSILEQRLEHVISWMKKNKLMLNDGKTELMTISSRPMEDEVSVFIGELVVKSKPLKKNLGVQQESTLTMGAPSEACL